MRILLISSAFNSMTQRFYLELADAGHEVAVELYGGDEARLKKAVGDFAPAIIFAPFLTRAIPEEIWRKRLCIVVHPGIEGDRGPSSLDWAIQEGWEFWGVTLLQAAAQMDAGPIWATRVFPLRRAPKSSVYRREAIEAAVECLWETLEKFSSGAFAPRPLDYARDGVHGRERPLMKQADRRIDWSRHATQEILARIHAADGAPGVLDEIAGKPFYLHNAVAEPALRGAPGAFLAAAGNGALCRATVDGAIWIGHLKPKRDGGIKLPAAQALGADAPQALTRVDTGAAACFGDHPLLEARCEVEDGIGYLHFDFHNGAMSTTQCELLRDAFRALAARPLRVIVLMGGEDHWSNGIHLNQIEAHDDPAAESWANINAMDDLVREIVTTADKLVVSALGNNAGAGGAILPLAADFALCREGVVLNPHYRNMGWLYGSEYWTYLLPRRVGWERAIELTESCLPVSARRAREIGLVDDVAKCDAASFARHARDYARSKFNIAPYLTAKKRLALQNSERRKPLSAYRAHELTQMYKNFNVANSPYHLARGAFVRKQGACWSPVSVAMLDALRPFAPNDFGSEAPEPLAASGG